MLHIVGENVDAHSPRFFMLTSLLTIITAEFFNTYLKMITTSSGEGINPSTEKVDGCVVDSFVI